MLTPLDSEQEHKVHWSFFSPNGKSQHSSIFLPQSRENTQLTHPQGISPAPRPPQPKDDVNTVLGIRARVKAEATVTSSEAGTSIRYQTAIIKRNEDPKNAQEKMQHSTSFHIPCQRPRARVNELKAAIFERLLHARNRDMRQLTYSSQHNSEVGPLAPCIL